MKKQVEHISTEYFVDATTGEAFERNVISVPAGSLIYTPDQQDSYRLRKEREKEYENLKVQNKLRADTIRNASKNSGKHFFFVEAKQNFDDLSPETLTRLIYLNTFLGYDGNYLMLSKKTKMCRKDLESVLGVSHGVAVEFVHETFPKYISEDQDGYLHSNIDIFKRGKMPRRTFTPYERFYFQGVRALYSATAPKNHKHLGYLFALLPYMSIQFNVICRNPDETGLEKIDFITLGEFCDMIGFDKSNLGRLIKTYRSLIFDVNGHLEKSVSFVNDCSERTESHIFINPKIFYAGDCPERVEILGAFCKI